MDIESFVRNKLAQVYALVFVVDYPSKVYGWLWAINMPTLKNGPSEELLKTMFSCKCAVASVLHEPATVCAVREQLDHRPIFAYPPGH